MTITATSNTMSVLIRFEPCSLLVDEPYGFSYDCGFPVEVSGVASGNYRLREGTGDDVGAFFSLDRISFREIHTNPETGAWFAFSGHFARNEITARRIDG